MESICGHVPGLQVVACGSYRRGKPICDDIAIVVTHPDGDPHMYKELFGLLLGSRNVEQGSEKFLHELLEFFEQHTGRFTCYIKGVCRLGEHRKVCGVSIMQTLTLVEINPYSLLPCIHSFI